MKSVIFISENLRKMRGMISALHHNLPSYVDIKLARIECNDNDKGDHLVEVGELPHKPYFQDRRILAKGISECLFEYEDPYLLTPESYTALLQAEQEDFTSRRKESRAETLLEKKVQEGEIYMGEEEIHDFITIARTGELPEYFRAGQ